MTHHAEFSLDEKAKRWDDDFLTSLITVSQVEKW